MSHAQRSGATHTEMPFKIVWLILVTKSCIETDRIDMTVDVNVKVNHVICIDVTPL
jgi:hypothetical protein